MSSLTALLVANGYAQNAAEALASAPIGHTPANARERVTAVAHNYYMQYLAIRLSRFGFELNQPRLKREQLVEAEALIDGKLGNAPLDNTQLATLLSSLVNDVLARHHHEGMTWGDFYHYNFHAAEDVSLRGEDMMKALIRSNALHYGARADIYHHSFNEIEYKTLSMHHLMARVLSGYRMPVKGVNAYGIAVKDEDIARIRKVVNRITAMRDPKLRGFFQQNAHHNIKHKLHQVFRELLSESADLFNVYQLHVQLVRDNFNPDMYNPEWQKLLYEMQERLQWIATPYARFSQPQTAAAVH